MGLLDDWARIGQLFAAWPGPRKSDANCARRSPDNTTSDGGSIPPISTIGAPETVLYPVESHTKGRKLQLPAFCFARLWLAEAAARQAGGAHSSAFSAS